jgi:hypothetical protein
MARKQKYEVVDFNHGGYFVHGGNLSETYFSRKEDADLVAEALNMMEALKFRQALRKIEEAAFAIESLKRHLTET